MELSKSLVRFVIVSPVCLYSLLRLFCWPSVSRSLISAGDSFGRSSVIYEFYNFTSESKGHLIILVVNSCAGVGSNVECLIPLKEERNCPLQFLGRNFLAVDLEHTYAAACDTADTVVRKCASTSPSYLKSNINVCLPGASSPGPSQRMCLRPSKFQVKTGLPFTR